jgi:hypothetical protein
MKINESWTEFGEGKYPDCHYEGRQWPGSLRELVLNGFADGMYLRQLYPIRVIGTGSFAQKETTEPTRKTCENCKFWMKTHNPFEGVCVSPDSLAATVDTVDSKFTCSAWEA